MSSLTEKEQKDLRKKLAPLIIRASKSKLDEHSLDAALQLLTVQQKRDIIKSTIDGTYDMAGITLDIISKHQAEQADVIIDDIIAIDKIELTYLLSIL